MSNKQSFRIKRIGMRRGLCVVVSAIAIAVAGGAALAIGASGCGGCSQGKRTQVAGKPRGAGLPWVAVDSPVALVPPLQGGSAGWCVIDEEEALGCKGTRFKKGPIVAEDWTGQFGGQAPNITRGWAITSPEVVAVSLADGRRFPTHAEAALPNHLRAVVLELTLKAGEPQPGRQLPLPQLKPLAATGRMIPQHATAGLPFKIELLGTQWRSPGSPPADGVCQIATAGVAGLTAEGGVVLTKLVPYRSPLGRPFLSCASTVYRLDQGVIRSSVLVDARHPGTTPAALPGMKPMPGKQSIFVAPGAEGKILARRIPHGWLVVDGDYGRAARLAIVLEHLSATIRL